MFGSKARRLAEVRHREIVAEIRALRSAANDAYDVAAGIRREWPGFKEPTPEDRAERERKRAERLEPYLTKAHEILAAMPNFVSGPGTADDVVVSRRCPKCGGGPAARRYERVALHDADYALCYEASRTIQTAAGGRRADTLWYMFDVIVITCSQCGCEFMRKPLDAQDAEE